jgi:hypothetical protein
MTVPSDFNLPGVDSRKIVCTLILSLQDNVVISHQNVAQPAESAAQYLALWRSCSALAQAQANGESKLVRIRTDDAELFLVSGKHQ